jgi:hypothetical protein
MINRDELKTVTGAVAAVAAAFGTNVPANQRRFIYKVKFINPGAAQTLSLGKFENGVVLVPMDVISSPVGAGETIIEPEELRLDSAPLYVITGPPAPNGVAPATTSQLRVVTSVGAGTLTVTYIDAPA